MRSQELSSLAQSVQFREQHIDFYLDPPVEEFNVLGYDKGREMVQIGYEDTMKKLESWRDELPHVSL